MCIQPHFITKKVTIGWPQLPCSVKDDTTNPLLPHFKHNTGLIVDYQESGEPDDRYFTDLQIRLPLD